MSQAEPGPEVEAARSFVTAVCWGDHDAVWNLLSSEGRHEVLRIATGRGMAEVAASRISDGTADQAEMGGFLVDLVNGLRTDFGGVDIDELDFEPGAPAGVESESSRQNGESAYVTVVHLPPEQLAQYDAPSMPVATIELARRGDGWRVLGLTRFDSR